MKNIAIPLRVHSERGASLIVVLMILVVVSLLGVGGTQIALMSERGARNDRDQLVAWQAAESALLDAEFDMTTNRTTVFDGKSKLDFNSECGATESIGASTSSSSCSSVSATKPAWLTVDFTDTDTDAPTVAFGAFTGRSFAAGGVGIQPEQVPRYVIEIVPDPIGDASNPAWMYRVTAMGFGPRADIQSVLQILYRI